MNLIKSYHAHFYFDHNSIETAKAIYTKGNKLNNIRIGNFNDKIVGPHPTWSFMFDFPVKELTNIMAWIPFNREGLSVLVHPNTGNAYLDHIDYASWFGKRLELNISKLK
jgi:DOPA 4,5-dioxygenase